MFFPINSSIARRLDKQGMMRFANAKRADRDGMDGPMIVGNFTKMSALPDHYSGREANSGDLSSDDLSKIYLALKAEYGDEAARQFCQMIYEMPNLAATPFLYTFFSFVANGCVWADTTPEDANFNAEAVKADPFGIGIATIGNMMANGGRVKSFGSTESIRQGFLQSHRGEFKRKKQIDHSRFRPGNQCDPWTSSFYSTPESEYDE